MADNYHLYAVEWEPTQIRWYVDNVLYSTQTNWNSSGAPYPAPFDKRFLIHAQPEVEGAAGVVGAGPDNACAPGAAVRRQAEDAARMPGLDECALRLPKWRAFLYP